MARSATLPRMRLVVLADSFAFTDDRGPQPPDEPALFPNVAARGLGEALGTPVEATTIARAGWGVRDVWRALTKDRHLAFEVLPGADAVVVAVGSFDHVPAGFPAALDAVVPFVRPAALRRRVRAVLRTLHPRLVVATGGRLPLTPTAEFARLLDLVLLQVRALTHAAPGVVVGPAGHAAAHYAGRNPHLAARARLTEEVAGRHGFPVVHPWPLVEPHLDRLNPDGIHWPADVHAALGRAIAVPLAEQAAGRRPRPPSVWSGTTMAP